MGRCLHVPVQWGIEVGHVLLREYRRKALRRAKLRQAREDLESFDPRTHLQRNGARQVVDLAAQSAVTTKVATPYVSILPGSSSSRSPGSTPVTATPLSCTGSRFSRPSDG
jgi:hypothetical protein